MKKGLYIHIPFCVKKCRYCAFNSYENMYGYSNEYIDTVIRHIKSLKKEEIDTIYIGGGTPSSIDKELIMLLMKSIYENFDVSIKSEITIEANPKTLDDEKIEAYLKSGINRISIGSQSFCDDELKTLGRIHTSNDIEKAVKIAKQGGFENINLDIIYALFNQNEESLKETIEKTLFLSPTHISCYGLMIEEGTKLFDDVKKGKYVPLKDEMYAKMYEIICDTLNKNGFLHYEISNFAKEEKYKSRHNLKYWQAGEYFGIGAGASGYENGKRYTNCDDILGYITDFSQKHDVENLTLNDKMSEYMILNLRLLDKGVDEAEFKDKFNLSMFDVFENELKYHIEKTKMLVKNKNKITLSKNAYYVSNAILCDFMI